MHLKYFCYTLQVSRLYKYLSILYGFMLLQHCSDLALLLPFFICICISLCICICICIIQLLRGCVLQTTVARLFRLRGGAVFGEMVRKKLDKLLLLTPSRSCHNIYICDYVMKIMTLCMIARILLYHLY